MHQQEHAKKKRGGKRDGAGRPQGTSKYGESSKPMRIPLSMISHVKKIIDRKGNKIPLYSNPVPAGNPIELQDNLEEMVDLADFMAPHPEKTYMVKVTGNSMIKVGIFEGDLLLVDTSVEAKHNDIVVACANNEMTVKRLCMQENQIYLMPENDDYAPIFLTEGEELTISGVVTFVIKQTG